MKNKLSKEQKICSSCGGELKRKDEYTYICPHCRQEYYISTDRTHKVKIHLSVKKLVLIIAAIIMGITGIGAIVYYCYAGALVYEASRFSVAFRDFLMEAYNKPMAKITEEDLQKIRYLKIEKDEKYLFTYSFEDYYDYNDWNSFEKTLKTVRIEADREDFSPANLEYFSGLTRVELYTEAWENYVLPEDNQLRFISCNDGLSRYGIPEFFTRLNPDTIEEVVINNADEMKDFSFLSDLKYVKSFTLKGAAIKSSDVLKNMTHLEKLTLENVVIKEENVYEIVRELCELPSIKSLTITGNSVWHITEEQWAELQENYQDKTTIRRE